MNNLLSKVLGKSEPTRAPVAGGNAGAVQLVFAVYDLKARAYMAPFTCATVGIAIREFARSVGHPGSPFAEFPEDFQLYQLGEFDSGSGELRSPLPPLPLARAIEFQKAVKPPEVNNG